MSSEECFALLHLWFCSPWELPLPQPHDIKIPPGLQGQAPMLLPFCLPCWKSFLHLKSLKHFIFYILYDNKCQLCTRHAVLDVKGSQINRSCSLASSDKREWIMVEDIIARIEIWILYMLWGRCTERSNSQSEFLCQKIKLYVFYDLTYKMYVSGKSGNGTRNCKDSFYINRRMMSGFVKISFFVVTFQ